MRTIRGPALFLAQFAGDAAPFNDWRSITAWAADCGYVGVQVPSWDARLFDLDRAAASKGYCDEIKDIAGESGIVITELSTHLQGQLVAVHPAYDAAFDGFAAPAVRGKPAARAEWAVDQVKKALTASRNLGLTAHAAFSGTLAWPYLYPWPQGPAGLVEEAFGELARRWTPIRFRSPGDGQVDFGAIFSKLTAHAFDGWAVVEWECCLKHPEDSARAGAAFVNAHLIRVTGRAFDDFADARTDRAANRRMLGLE